MRCTNAKRGTDVRQSIHLYPSVTVTLRYRGHGGVTKKAVSLHGVPTSQVDNLVHR